MGCMKQFVLNVTKLKQMVLNKTQKRRLFIMLHFQQSYKLYPSKHNFKSMRALLKAFYLD